MNQSYSELSNFLSNNVFNKHVIDIGKPEFSTTSKIMLQQLFNNLISAERTYQLNKISSTTLDLSTNFPRGTKYTYCPLYIRNEIENMTKVGMHYTFKLKARTFNVIFICSDKITNLRKYMNQSIKQIYMWLYIASRYASDECSRQMNIYLYLTNIQKRLPSKGEAIQQINVNTAFTTSCANTTEIMLFRQEEWFKTFIHETFHNMGLDFSAYNNQLSEKAIFLLYPVSNDIRLYETYCEMWAEMFVIIFKVYRSMRHNTSIEHIHVKIPKLIDNVGEVLVNEIKHSLFQAAKILSHFNITYNSLIGNITSTVNYKETTPVLSYYIIKSTLLFHIDSFLSWCALNNHVSINFTKLNERQPITSKITKYIKLIQSIYNDKSYINTLNSMQRFFLQIKHIPENKYILENMRMTITEF
jgi:hypothetical protein